MYLKIKGRRQKARRAAGCESPLQSFIVVVSAITAIFRARCSFVAAILSFHIHFSFASFPRRQKLRRLHLGASVICCRRSGFRLQDFGFCFCDLRIVWCVAGHQKGTTQHWISTPKSTWTTRTRKEDQLVSRMRFSAVLLQGTTYRPHQPRNGKLTRILYLLAVKN